MVGPHDVEGALTWAQLSIYNHQYLFKNHSVKTPTKQYYIFLSFIYANSSKMLLMALGVIKETLFSFLWNV